MSATLQTLVLGCLIGASALDRPALHPVLSLRGGAYPVPKAGYHAFAARGALLSKMETMPNLLSGGLAGCFVARFGVVNLFLLFFAVPETC